jgi:hypothetical protein
MVTSAPHRTQLSPLRQLGTPDDWSDIALQRTWRSVGTLCMGLGLVNAFLWLAPGATLCLLGAWAYRKGMPSPAHSRRV